MVTDEAWKESDKAYNCQPYDPEPIKACIDAILANPDEAGFADHIWALFSCKYVPGYR